MLAQPQEGKLFLLYLNITQPLRDCYDPCCSESCSLIHLKPKDYYSLPEACPAHPSKNTGMGWVFPPPGNFPDRRDLTLCLLSLCTGRWFLLTLAHLKHNVTILNSLKFPPMDVRFTAVPNSLFL